MTTITNAENFRQYKSRFSLIVEQILAFTLSTNLDKEVKISLEISNELHNNALRYR